MKLFSTILKDRNLKPMLSFVLFVLVLVMLYLIYDRTLREGGLGRRRAYSPMQNDDAAAKAAIARAEQKIRAENRLYRQHNFQPSTRPRSFRSGIYSSTRQTSLHPSVVQPPPKKKKKRVSEGEYDVLNRSTSSTSGSDVSAYAQRPLPLTPRPPSPPPPRQQPYEQPSGPIYEPHAGTLGPVGGARGYLPGSSSTYDMVPPGQRSATLNRNQAAGASNNTPGPRPLTQTQQEQLKNLGFFSI